MMLMLAVTLQFFCAIIGAIQGVEAGSEHVDLVVIILSQPNTFHDGKARQLQQSIYDQAYILNISMPSVVLTHELWPEVTGSWAVLPIIPLITEKFGIKKSAVLFCEDDVSINLTRLLKKLGKVDFTKELFLGRALRDQDATIIHHFAFHENPSAFPYPDVAAGFIISTPLLWQLADRLNKSPASIDFTIDAQHELALYIWDKGSGVSLTDVDYLCGYTAKSTKCATRKTLKAPDCVSAVSDLDVFFAVKTCQKFHKDRVSVLKKTWGKDAERIQFFSDVDDPSVPTVTLGIPNTERGHCAKFLAILKYIHRQLDQTDYKWIVIVDDDTLLSVSRLKKLLSCYNPSELVVLGERYGYGIVRGVGYDYVTLGGGMALSHVVLRQLIDSDTCHCASDDAPDDMMFGLCVKHLGIPITHSPLFHQARPVDYADNYLSNQDPVSFHRHWMVDPVQVYRRWLTDDESSADSRSRDDRSGRDRTAREDL